MIAELITDLILRGVAVGRKQEDDSIRITIHTLTDILQAHFDGELGEGKVTVLDVDLLKRKGVAEVWVEEGPNA